MEHDCAGDVGARRSFRSVRVPEFLHVDKLIVKRGIRAAKFLRPVHRVPALIDKLLNELMVMLPRFGIRKVDGANVDGVSLKISRVPIIL